MIAADEDGPEKRSRNGAFRDGKTCTMVGRVDSTDIATAVCDVTEMSIRRNAEGEGGYSRSSRIRPDGMMYEGIVWVDDGASLMPKQMGFNYERSEKNT